MEIVFFMPMNPPAVTQQEHKVTVRGGKPVFYEPPELKDARAKLTAHLSAHAPEKPLDGAVRLVVKWLFPVRKGHHDGEYKQTKPDTDNLNKLLKDCMTDLRFWHDDAQVASEIIEKFYSDITGIYVYVSELKEQEDGSRGDGK